MSFIYEIFFKLFHIILYKIKLISHFTKKIFNQFYYISYSKNPSSINSSKNINVLKYKIDILKIFLLNNISMRLV